MAADSAEVSASGPPRVGGTGAPAGSEAVVVGAGAGPSPPAAFTTRQAAVLKYGCLETGSQMVMVSSLACRGAPSDAASSGSQRP